MNWIKKITFKLKLNTIVYFRSVNIFDTYISKTNKYKLKKFKIIAAISIYLSSKLEEINPINLKDIHNHVLNKEYPLNYLKKKEVDFLNIIEFDTHKILLIDYLNYFINHKNIHEYFNFKEDLINLFKKDSAFLLKLVLQNLKLLQKYEYIDIVISILYFSFKIIEKRINLNIKDLIKNIVEQLNIEKNKILYITKEIYYLFTNK